MDPKAPQTHFPKRWVSREVRPEKVGHSRVRNSAYVMIKTVDWKCIRGKGKI